LEPCSFCNLDPARIWLENEHAVAFGDPAPATDGHTLVAPRKHVSTVYQLSIIEQQAVFQLVSQVRSRLLTGLKPECFSIGFTDSMSEEPQEKHVHVHVVPRPYGNPPQLRAGVEWVTDDLSKR
jgi:diadenosine tetraphosphate (Ap4A) HIT family hydrolase